MIGCFNNSQFCFVKINVNIVDENVSLCKLIRVINSLFVHTVIYRVSIINKNKSLIKQKKGHGYE